MNIFDVKDGHSKVSNQHDTKIKDSISFFQTDEEKDFPQNVVFETVHTESYGLSYACLLVPRFPSHQIKGDLADLLPQWLHTICLSFNWRLGFLEAMPGYLHWGLFVSSSDSPNLFMQIIRTETSKLIFSNFGHIQRENLGQDFWAHSHLLAVGTHPHSKEWIEYYIREIRRQQGFNTL
ncbi:MAG: transposase [Chloroflexi bacterium]|nr:transposase [Chloroflexota bacterium]